jgi:hypothetical protein
MRGGQSGYRRVEGGRVTTRLIVSGAERNSFDYTILSPDMADEARAAVVRIKDRLRTASYETGRDLIAIKAKLPHGSFGLWVNAEFGLSIRMAENYMAAARFLEGKSENVSFLPPSAIYPLAAPNASPEVVREVLEQVDAGVRVTVPMIRDKLAGAAAIAQKQADTARSSELINAEKQRRAEQEAGERKREEAEASAQDAAKFLVSQLGSRGVLELLRLASGSGLARVERLFKIQDGTSTRTLTAGEIEARFGEPAPDAECAEAVMATVH